MKTFFSMLIVITGVAGTAADLATQKLQQGLFEEEARHDLKAAIQAYEAVVQQGEEQRKILATAIFRLGECHRKLGQTNEAQAYYSRIFRDFSDQRQLVELSRRFHPPSPMASGDAEVVRELERRHARLLGELVEANARVQRMKIMSSDEARAASQLFDDPQVQTLQNSLITAQQEAASLAARGLGEGHADMRAVTARMKLIRSQLTERLAALVDNEIEAAKLLDNQVSAIEQELARVNARPTSTASAMSPEAVALLQQEIALAAQQVASAERFFAAGKGSVDDVLQARKEALRLTRMLPENNAPTRQKALLDQQIEIVKQSLQQVEQRVRSGQMAQATVAELGLKRELLALQREITGVSASAAGPPRPDAGPALTAAEAEALARVKSLALNSPDILQSPGKDGLSELQRAATDGFYSVVEFILSQKANPNGLENGTSPPLLLAAQRGHLRVVQLLLDHGADVNAAFTGTTARPSYINGFTALMAAAESGFRAVVELLLVRGADVDRASSIGSTALHHASLKGHVSTAELLLKAGAKTHSLARLPYNLDGWPGWAVNGASPLHLAADRGALALVELLLNSGALVNATNYMLQSPLNVALQHPAVCAHLLKIGADPNATTRDGSTPLATAILTGRPKVVALLLTNGADVNRQVNVRNDNEYPQFPIHMAVSRGSLDEVLSAKPDLEVTNRNGSTPLFQAIELRSSVTVEALLRAGANPNRRIFDVPPILAAVEKLSVAPVRSLLEHGANPNVSGPTGVTPLSLLRQFKAHGGASGSPADVNIIEQLLVQHGANEYLSRLFAIDYTRPGWRGEPKVFYRGTNDYNQYTLFEFLACIFVDNASVPFPDLSRVIIERIEGTNSAPTNVAVNAEVLLKSGDCSKDMWLKWGDRLVFPELDHPLNQVWPGLSPDIQQFLRGCLKREVYLVVKGETNKVLLEFAAPTAGVPREPPAASARTPSITTVRSFRLKDVVYSAHVLRASSDPTRVRVTRPASTADTAQRWDIDLTQVQASKEVQAGPGRLWFQHDLWLRNGDIIEIPEK